MMNAADERDVGSVDEGAGAGAGVEGAGAGGGDRDAARGAGDAEARATRHARAPRRAVGGARARRDIASAPRRVLPGNTGAAVGTSEVRTRDEMRPGRRDSPVDEIRSRREKRLTMTKKIFPLVITTTRRAMLASRPPPSPAASRRGAAPRSREISHRRAVAARGLGARGGEAPEPTPPLRVTSAFLADPECALAEDADGLATWACPPGPEGEDPDPSLGWTHRPAVLDLSRETARDGEARGATKERRQSAPREPPSSDARTETEPESDEDRAAAGCRLGEDEHGLPAVDCGE